MVVINEKKDNRKYAFLMTLVPDKAYLESTHFAAFSSNYRKWQKGYSGYVFYHTLDGKFNNGWKFENGKVTMSATQVDENGVDISMGAKRKVSSGTICTTLTYEIWTARCQYTYTISETQGIQNLSIGTCGSYDYQGNQYLEICYDDGNSGGAINNPPPSGTTPTTPPTNECVGDKCPMCGGIVNCDLSETGPSNVKSADPFCAKCTCKRDYPKSKECLAYMEMYNSAIADKHEYTAILTSKGIHSWKTEEDDGGRWCGPYNPKWDASMKLWYIGPADNKEYVTGATHVHWDSSNNYDFSTYDAWVAVKLSGAPLFLFNIKGEVKGLRSPDGIQYTRMYDLPANFTFSNIVNCDKPVSLLNYCSK